MVSNLRRKLAIASWAAPREGNIYGKVTMDATEALAYLADVRERTGEKVTITHLVGKAVAKALASEPSLNGRIVMGQFKEHASVDITFLVAMADGSDLAKAKIAHTDTKDVATLARELREQATKLRDGKDADWEKSKGLIKILPVFLLRRLLWCMGLLSSSFGVGSKALGIEKYPFGSAIITSVGMFGVDEGFAPPTPFARVPIYVLVGAVRERAAVVDGKVVPQMQITVTATIDHRFIDGFQGGVLAREFRNVFADPWSLDAQINA
jgi:pyruvate/2-oxoglutarate dehydrogenase complex dihydrolipoamide acyltransferase (E2) component